ncbi:MAG TPA: serine O-acetyltransferase EpsC [Opitutaceae bacterium]|nr:serine O-acetyltransferase EpsC [Opitutaceae bacterium]
MNLPKELHACLYDPLNELAPQCRAWQRRERLAFAWRQLGAPVRDYAAILRQDPALLGRRGGRVEALLYPGFWALAAHRVAHLLDAAGLPVVPRMLNFAARFVTSVDIHPGARIGAGLFIDHGDGVVIGETAEIGRDVVMLHQVTLGGRGGGRGKRHPTVGDGVFLGAGAKILGAVEIGAGARVGANAVVLTNIPAGATAVGIPAQIVRRVPRATEQQPELCCAAASAASPLAV